MAHASTAEFVSVGPDSQASLFRFCRRAYLAIPEPNCLHFKTVVNGLSISDVDPHVAPYLENCTGAAATIDSQALRMHYRKSEHSSFHAPDTSGIIFCLRLPLLLSVLFYHGYLSWPELLYMDSKGFLRPLRLPLAILAHCELHCPPAFLQRRSRNSQ